MCVLSVSCLVESQCKSCLAVDSETNEYAVSWRWVPGWVSPIDVGVDGDKRSEKYGKERAMLV